MTSVSRPQVLLLGGTGYIGRAFQRCLKRRGITFRIARRRECNYCDREKLDRLLKQIKPDFLINAAGSTGKPNVDACENDKTACLLGNAILPGIIYDVCQNRRVPWGHVSSGCIYTGKHPDGRGFREYDPPNFSFRQNNCSFYSGCKALGEELLSKAEGCYVWRLRIPFDCFDSPRNYLSKLMRYERLLDARNSLSQLDEFVQACVDCLIQRVDFGIYNLTNTGSVTTREVVEMIRRSGVCKKTYDFFASEEEFMRMAAKTPRSNCLLDNRKARNTGLFLSHVTEAIEQALCDWQPEHKRRPVLVVNS